MVLPPKDDTSSNSQRSHRVAQKLLRKRVIIGVGIVAALAVAITLLAVLVPKHQQNHPSRDAPIHVPVQALHNETEHPWVEGHHQSSSDSSSSSSDAGDSGGGDSSSSSSSSSEEASSTEEGSSSEGSFSPMVYQFTPPGAGYAYQPPGGI